jgi:tight adherence protein B
MRLGLVIPLLILALVGVGLAVIVSLSGKRKQLEARIAASMTRVPAAEAPLTRTGTTVRIRQEKGSRWQSLNWLLRMPIDLPLAHVVSPVFVLLMITLLAAVTVWGSHYLISIWFAVLAGLAVWIAVARAIFGWELERYRALLLRQLPDTIHLVISATRAGLPVSESFRTVTQEMPNPTSAEFARVVDEMALGVNPDDALLNMHRRTGVTEYAIFAVTIGVQARSGGRLAETISNLADTVRDRIALVGKARAVSAEARTSAIIMTVLPIITGAVLSFARPGYLRPLIADSRGQNMLVFGVVTLVLGMLTMRHMIKGATRD